MASDAAMTLGMVGLGRMGAGLSERLRRAGHTVVGYDANPALSEVRSLAELVAALPRPRVAWLMVPAGAVTEETLQALLPLLEAGDIVIDGGNSYHKDSVRRAVSAAVHGVQYLDIGTSGGIWGLEVGFCLMAGGPREAFDHVEPILAALAPPDGYRHLGPSGAGHFAKMVHNGIEYGMMQAIGEGFHLLQAAPEYGFDLPAIAALWNQGSVVRSWLVELAGRALAADPALQDLSARVDDSGEGRWTVLEGVERGVNVSVLAEALFARFTSRDDQPFAMRLIAALRNEFGGHAVYPGRG
jgi:6-phosphogluconate dehydrogenase